MRTKKLIIFFFILSLTVSPVLASRYLRVSKQSSQNDFLTNGIILKIENLVEKQDYVIYIDTAEGTRDCNLGCNPRGSYNEYHFKANNTTEWINYTMRENLNNISGEYFGFNGYIGSYVPKFHVIDKLLGFFDIRSDSYRRKIDSDNEAFTFSILMILLGIIITIVIAIFGIWILYDLRKWFKTHKIGIDKEIAKEIKKMEGRESKVDWSNKKIVKFFDEIDKIIEK